jgi:ribosomal protein S18 acetylase RimI-like enzyme
MTEPHARGYMRAVLRPQRSTALPNMRAPVAEDVAALAQLMFSAYAGTIDQEEETLEDSLAEIHKTFGGDYGNFMAGASRVIHVSETLTSAALLTRWQDRPFVAFSLTLPNFQRRGLARACLLSAMEHLCVSGETELRLVVTLANAPARLLYEHLGFVLE